MTIQLNDYANYCPYVFHSLRALPKITQEDRELYLKKYGYNVLLLSSDKVIFDLSTDSHSAAVSNSQLGSMNKHEHSPLGFGTTTEKLSSQLSDALNYPYMVLTIQGRTGKFILNRAIVNKGQLIPCNATSLSTQYHQKLLGGIPTNISCDEAFDFTSNEIFKGNIKIAELKNILENKKNDVAYINIELCSNAIGGYPVSLKNLKESYNLAKKYQTPLILDSTRIIENALMIREHEPGYKEWSIAEIVHEIGNHSDGCILSLKKDFPTNVGGAVGLRSEKLFFQLRDFNFNLGSDLPEEKIEAISIGIEEVLHNDDYVSYRNTLTQRLYKQLKSFGVPVINPCSSYGVWIDTSEFIKHIPEYENPHIALANSLYIQSGIRTSVSEIELNQKTKRLLRCAIPHRLLTESHIDYIAFSIQNLYKHRFQIQGYSLNKTSPRIVGHILSTYEPVKPVSSVGELFFKQVNRFGEKNALRVITSDNTSSVTYQHLGMLIKQFASGLCYLGYKKGDKIGFLTDTSLETVVSYLSTASVGIVDVPIYGIYSPKQIKNVILTAEIKCLIVSDGQLSKVKEIVNEIPWKVTIIISDSNQETNKKWYTFKQVCKFCQNSPSDEFNRRFKQVQPSDLLSIVYSSGTTGEPKGVMVSHDSLVLTCSCKNYIYDINDSDVLLLQARVSHAFGRILLFYAFNQGASVLLGSQDKVLEQINQLKPTIIAATPVFFDNIYQSLIDYSPKLKQMNQTNNYNCSNLIKIPQSVRELLGGNIRFAITGGAPTPKKLLDFFKASDIPFLQSYGATETCGIASETLSCQKYGTVGKIRPELNYKLTEQRELLIKTPYLMKGYYKNSALTNSSFINIDGEIYYKTGDIVNLDKQGYVKIIGRSNESFPLSCGYNIQPQFIENLLCENEFINDAFVFGEGDKFISALIVPNIPSLKDTLNSQGLIHVLSLDTENLLCSQEVQLLFDNIVQRLNNEVADAEKIRMYILLPKPFSDAKGEINENGKKKRDVIYNNYKTLITSYAYKKAEYFQL